MSLNFRIKIYPAIYGRIYRIKTIRSSKENMILNVQLFKKYTKIKAFLCPA